MNNERFRNIVREPMKLVTALEKLYPRNMAPNLNNSINKLCADLTVLRRTWSSMAEKNLLNDVLRDLVSLERLLPADNADLKKICSGAKQAVASFFDGCTVINARYENVLCLGYRIQTGGFPKYNGKTDDWKDMNAKCDKLKEAIRSAYTLAKSYHDQGSILKIFMAPEFYFRGINGAYGHDVVCGREASGWIFKTGAKKGIMDLMAEEVDKDIYKDWLFVMGTAIAASRENKVVCAQCGGDISFVQVPGSSKSKPICKKETAHKGTKETKGGARIDNFAFIRKGKEDYTVTKALISDLDFIKDSTGPNPVTNVVTVGGKELDVLNWDSPLGAEGQPSKFQDERMGGSIFTIDGVTFGLEVCLDHKASTKNPTQGRLDHAANIQVQLIPSAGMWIQQFRATPQGVIFNVDGKTPHVEVRGGILDSRRQFWREWRRNSPGQYGTHDQTKADSAVTTERQEFDDNWRISRWQASEARLANATDGSVVMYGPYLLPSTVAT